MSSPAAPPGARLPPGAVLLDRYRVVEAVALGGHSLVYLGHDLRLERPVCIKVFTRYPTDAGIARTSYQHFVQEAFALSRLTHPHTLRIYDYGHLADHAAGGDAGAAVTVEDAALPFHVSEWMNGGTLAQRVRELGARTPADAARVVVALGEALAEAHALGIIHRDLKPQNILFAQPDGTLPKLADFGIAKWHEAEGAATGAARAGDTQQVSGHRMSMYSPSWAAPEQLAGQPTGPSADVYSLALLAVFMLTGRAIFADDDVVEGYRKRKSGPALLAGALEPLGLAPRALALLEQALAFDPAQRPDDAGAFGRALAAALDLAPLPAPLAVARAATEVDRGPGPDEADRPDDRGLDRGPARPRPAPRRLPWSAEPVAVAGRTARFVVTSDGAADVSGLGGAARLRVTALPGPAGRQLHVKGLSCFVARAGARPSTAVALDGDAMLELVGAGSAPVGKVRVSLGAPAAGHTVFRFGDDAVALDVDECPRAVLVDFGAGAECAFVHAPPSPAAHKRG